MPLENTPPRCQPHRRPQRCAAAAKRSRASTLSLLLVCASAAWAPQANAFGIGSRDLTITLLVGTLEILRSIPLSDPILRQVENVVGGALIGTLIFNAVPDPYFAFRLDLTNTGATPEGFLINFSSPMVPVPNPLPGADPAMFTVLSTAELFDANGNGSASFGSLDVGFGLSNSAPSAGSGPLILPQFTGFSAPGKQTIFDVGPTPVPASPVGQWDTMTYFINGFFGPLSPGDRVVLEVFGCVALPGTACPAPPDLSAIPLPAAVWFLAPALAGLAACAHRQRGLTVPKF